jgi:hypothetical protein
MAVDFSVLSEKRHVNRLCPLRAAPGRKRARITGRIPDDKYTILCGLGNLFSIFNVD